MPAITNQEWLNSNALRAYPFQEDMQLRPSYDGALLDDYRLPNGAILDMAMSSSSYDDPPRVYMKSFTLAGGVVTVVIANADDDELLASVSFRPDREADGFDPAAPSPVNFSGIGVHDDIRGTIVFGNVDELQRSLPDGIYSYTPEETTFESRCVRPSVPGVSGIYITNSYGAYETRRLRGDVAFMAGRNVRLDFDEANNAIVFNADASAGVSESCDCETPDGREQIMTINGISAGNVVIEGDNDCVKVTTERGRITISDTCSKPCCGCAELTFLNDKTNEIVTALDKLDQFSTELQIRLNKFVSDALFSERSSTRYV